MLTPPNEDLSYERDASGLAGVVPEVNSETPPEYSSKLHIETGVVTGRGSETSGSCWPKVLCGIALVVVLAGAAMGALMTMKDSDADEPTIYNAVFTITLQGITASQFDAAAQISFKTVVASNAGTICGAAGTTLCTASDVTILSYSRRTATTSFEIATYGQNSASTAVTDLQTSMASSGFTTELAAAGGNLASVSGVSVISANSVESGTTTATPTATPTSAPTAAPTATPLSIPTANPTSVPTDTPTDTPTSAPTAVPTYSPCDASAAPANGAVGDCTSSLASGSTCQPTCNTAYTVSGPSSCNSMQLTAATCSSSYHLATEGANTCTTGSNPGQNDCLAAAQSALPSGTTQASTDLVVLMSNDLPPGCSVQSCCDAASWVSYLFVYDIVLELFLHTRLILPLADADGTLQRPKQWRKYWDYPAAKKRR